MTIQRDEGGIKFHELGTLHSVTRWISTHAEGLAEWLKNVRRAYQSDRANVPDDSRVAVLLMKDADDKSPAALGMLDVGGATLEDVKAWSTWQDFTASGRGSGVAEEQTQGNGAKAYMYRLFSGRARILGVRDGKLNCKGFEGPSQSLDRGWPGFIPNDASARELPVASWRSELNEALKIYDIQPQELPEVVMEAIEERHAFTLVEGWEPKDLLYKGRIPEDIVTKVLRHDQATAAIEQLRIYAVHNGHILNEGKPLQLEPIDPYPGFEQTRVFDIPESLKDDDGAEQSTTLNGERPTGRLVLYTSRKDMPRTYKNLKPRWKITYKANQNHIIGSKPISDFAPGIPGSYFIYGVVELAAFEPDYVALGRVRPNDGPLISAVDRFISERIKELAKEINEHRRQELDDDNLDEVQRENSALDRFKNQFLESVGPGGSGANPGDGKGPIRQPDPEPPDFGETPDSIELEWETGQVLKMGCGVFARMSNILGARVRDRDGKTVPRVDLEWFSDDRHVVEFSSGDRARAVRKGTARIWCRVRGTRIESPHIEAEVWFVDHVLLTPRTLEVPLGDRKLITAQVTNDEGDRAINVLLNWKHDAPDSLIVRISPWGRITGNRIGNTSISAGAGEESEGGVWARIRAEVTVTPNPKEQDRGGGFPKLLVTDRDVDPVTGEVREANPDMPTLWQEVSDYQNNIWWLNLGSPEAAFLFKAREENPNQWRSFHVRQVIEMVVQIHMKEEFDAKGDNERPDLWNRHKATLESFQVLLMQAMWEKLQPYIKSGTGLE